MTNFISQLVFKMLSVVLGTAFIVTGTISGTSSKKPIDAPNDFTPVVRFVACSDIHLDGEENQQAAIRFANLFKDMYEYAESCEYKKLDAVLVAGDFTGGGAEKEYQMFNKIVEENKKDETQLLTVLGNHEFIEYRDVDATVGYDVYRKYINENVDTDIVINGYHFIGVSYDDNGSSFSGKKEWLDQLPPAEGGGEMIEHVRWDKTTYNVLPYKFEAGTPNYIGSYAFSKAIEYVQEIGIEEIARYEEELVEYIEERLSGLERVKIYAAGQKKAGAVSFNVYRADGGLIHPFDVGVLLDRQGVAVRTGHHCAEPLIEHLGVPGTLRASVGLYNTKEDIDKLIAALERAIMMLE